MSDNQSDFGAFLAGFVIGGLVGAATAIILAPKSGEEMREQLISKSRDLREAGGARVQTYRQQANEYTGEYRDRAEHLIADARERVQEAGGQVQEQARIVLDSGKERATQLREQVNDIVSKTEAEGKESPKGDATAQ